MRGRQQPAGGGKSGAARMACRAGLRAPNDGVIEVQGQFGNTEIEAVAEASQLLKHTAGVTRNGVGRRSWSRTASRVT
jgi:ABC-type transport system involved in cytochrome c biogenesis ATPase subunit